MANVQQPMPSKGITDRGIQKKACVVDTKTRTLERGNWLIDELATVLGASREEVSK